jgi:hypothetical protein
MKTRRGRNLVTSALLAFAGLFCILSLPLSSSARRFPLFAGMLTIVMASLQLLTDLRRPIHEGDTSHDAATTSEQSTILWAVALVAGVYVVGLSVAFPVFTGLYWRKKDNASWPAAIGVAVCIIVFVDGILASLLRVDLYRGLISQWLRI